jgi:hypothetical protein
VAETILVSFVEIVGGLVDVAARRSDGSGMNALRWRTRGLLDPPQEPRDAVERERASIDLEYGYWDAAISYLLLPAQRDGVLAALHADCEEDGPERVSEDPWALLQLDKRGDWERAREAKVMRALQAATRACRKYERTRRTGYLRDAVFELASAIRYEREQPSPGLPKAAWRRQGDRLGRALQEVLPSSAFWFLAKTMREAIARDIAKVGRTSAARGTEREQILSREAWADGLAEEREVGAWFVDWLQVRYEEEMERYRLAEEVEERRLQQAAEDLHRWEAARCVGAEEASLKRAEEAVLESAAAPEPSIPPRAKDAEDKHAPDVPPPSEPKMQSDFVAWPAHAEENARLNEEVRQGAIAEQLEVMQARQLWASKEVERIHAEGEDTKRVEAFQARARRKASPARIQSSGLAQVLRASPGTRNPDKSGQIRTNPNQD